MSRPATFARARICSNPFRLTLGIPSKLLTRAFTTIGILLVVSILSFVNAQSSAEAAEVCRLSNNDLTFDGLDSSDAKVAAEAYASLYAGAVALRSSKCQVRVEEKTGSVDDVSEPYIDEGFEKKLNFSDPLSDGQCAVLRKKQIGEEPRIVDESDSDNSESSGEIVMICPSRQVTWTLSVDRASITEAPGKVTVEVTVSTGPSGVTFDSNQQIALTVSPNAANDLSGVPTELMLPATARKVSVTIKVIDDKIVEDIETFTITASIREQEVEQEVDSAQLTIIDDDVAAWSLSVSPDDDPITENGGSATVTISTGGVKFEGDRNITLALGGNASQGTDYRVLSEELTLAAGDDTVSAEDIVEAIQDDIVEGDETIVITASTKDGEAVGDAQTVTIRDDDMVAWSLSVSPDDDPITENGGSATVTISTGGVKFEGDRNITLALGGNASQGTDYRVLSEELTLAAGDDTVSAEDIVEAIQDDIVEGDETIVITASTKDGEAVGDAQTVTIRDDDMVAWSLSVSPDDDPITENGGSATVTISTGGVKFEGDRNITLALGGNASQGTDYRVLSEELTLAAGDDTVSAEDIVEAIQDDIVEGDETIVITASTKDGEAVGDAQTVTIRDDDMVAWSLSVSPDDDPITENGGSATVTISTGGVKFEGDRNITLALGGNASQGTDYRVLSEELTLAAGDDTVSAEDIVEAIQDDIVEGDETIVITASTKDGEAVGDAQTVTIRDDDMVAWSLSVSPDDDPITENGGSATVTISTGGVKFEGDRNITLALGGNASQGTDYRVLSEELTLAAGDDTVSAEDIVEAIQDDIVEGDETIVITASTKDGEAVGDAQTVTIRDDDMVAWSLSVSPDDDPITENGGSATVTISTGGVKFEGDRNITLALGGNASQGTDYRVLSEELTLAAGDDTVSAEDIVEAIQDSLVEGDETIVIAASTDDGEAVGVAQTVTIRDDDMAAWNLSVAPTSIVEASGSATVTVSTGGVTFNSDQAITLSVAQGSTAIAGEDFVQLQSLTLVAGANTVSTTIEAIQDDIVEGDETIVVSATSDGEAVGSSRTLTIEDDDQAEIKVTETVLMLSEGTADSQGAVDTFSIELGSQPASPVTVTVRSSDVSAVTVTPTSPLRFTSHDWNVAQDVTVRAVEDSDANNEMVAITYEVNGPGTYAGLVPDDDVMVMVQVIDDDVSQPERELVEDTVRTVTATTVSNITTNIGARFSAARTGTSLTSLSLAGHSVTQPSAFEETEWNALWNQESHSRTLSSDELLRSTDFQIVLGASEGTQAPTAEAWTFWGRGDLQFFSSQPSQGSSYDGDLRAGYLGLDTQVDDQWLAGVALSRTMAEANYALGIGGADNGGTMDVTLTSLIPYVRFAPDDESELWAIVGVGQGEIENTRPHATAEQESSSAAMLMASAGGRHAVALGDPLDWALLADVGFGRVLTEDGVEAIAGLTVDTWQARMGIEGSYTMDMGDGGTLTAFMEVAGRYDGGDEGEAGLELSPGMYIARPDTGFGLELRGRALVLHSAENYEEYGLSATASVTPRSDGTGLSLSLSPRWGDDTGGADTLWRDDSLGLLDSSPSDRNAMSLDARVGYGLKAMNGLLTPFSEFGLREEDSQHWRIGARFDRTRANPGALSLELSGERRESLDRDPEHRVGLISRMQF